MKKSIIKLALVFQILMPSAFAASDEDNLYYSSISTALSSGLSAFNNDGYQLKVELDSYNSGFSDAYLTAGAFDNYTAAKSSFDNFYANYQTELSNIINDAGAVYFSTSIMSENIIDIQMRSQSLDSIQSFRDQVEYGVTLFLVTPAADYSRSQTTSLQTFWGVIPEPSTYGLIGIGALGLAFAARRRKLKKAA